MSIVKTRTIVRVRVRIHSSYLLSTIAANIVHVRNMMLISKFLKRSIGGKITLVKTFYMWFCDLALCKHFVVATFNKFRSYYKYL